MHRRSALVSLLVGGVAFLVGAVAVTEALSPYVWPSLLVGIPVGVVVGLSTVALAYLVLAYRRERRETGAVSTGTRRRLRATVAAVIAGMVVGGATVGGIATAALGLALALLVGLIVGVVAAAIAAMLVWVRRRDDERLTI
jgi:MFS family permease